MRTATTMVLWGLASCPALCAVIVHLGGGGVPLAIPRSDHPSLTFNQYFVDLGRIEPKSHVGAVFIFKNRGNENVVIDRVDPSCGCMLPRLEEKTTAPGGKGRLVLQIEAAGQQPGPKVFYADVHYHDTKPRSVRVAFRAEIPEKQLIVRPKALLFYQLNGEPSHEQILVTDLRGGEFQVTDVKVKTPSFGGAPLVEAVVGERTIDKEGVVSFQIDVHVTGVVPPGKHQALVAIETDKPDFPKVHVPVMIHGPGPADSHESDRPVESRLPEKTVTSPNRNNPN